MQDTLHRAEVAMTELFENFPIAIAGKALRVMFMPFGRRFKRPAITTKVSKILQTPCDARSRLGEGQYFGSGQF